MAWLEITIPAGGQDVQALAQALTCAGFSDLVIEDQGEFEQFLEENRACWDYIDENFQKRLMGLSQIKLYLEDTDFPDWKPLRKKEICPCRKRPLPRRIGMRTGRRIIRPSMWESAWRFFLTGLRSRRRKNGFL